MADDGNCLFVRFNWNHSALPFTMHYPYVTFKDIHLSPSDEFPTGRKGLALASYWDHLGNGRDAYTGILILDGDVTIDPEDLRLMIAAIDEHPDWVHTAPVKLWVMTQNGYKWFWSHSNDGLTQECEFKPRYFSFCFTYLPRELLYAASRMGLRQWIYPFVDESVSMVAEKLEIPVSIIPAAPKHVHY
jgi:hypothetical protein